MRKAVIYVTKWTRIPYMDFSITNNGKEIHLFTMPYTKNVYQFFKNGKSIGQLREYKKWKKNDVLSRLIEKRIPYELNKLRKGGELIYE